MSPLDPGSPAAEELRARFRSMETEQIREQLASGALPRAARSAAETELRQREGHAPPAPVVIARPEPRGVVETIPTISGQSGVGVPPAVRVVSFDMPFLSMVWFMVRWSIAAIPAMVIVTAFWLALLLLAWRLLGLAGIFGRGFP